MSSFSPPSPRTCGGSQRWSPGHRHTRLSAWCRARVKASGSSAKEPASNGAAQSPNHQQAISATKSARNGLSSPEAKLVEAGIAACQRQQPPMRRVGAAESDKLVLTRNVAFLHSRQLSSTVARNTQSRIDTVGKKTVVRTVNSG